MTQDDEGSMMKDTGSITDKESELAASSSATQPDTFQHLSEDALPEPSVVPEPRFTNTGSQAVPSYSLHEVNTATASLLNSGMNHTEGCWPREIDPTDGEQVARWRKRVERDEDYIRTALHLGAVVEELVRQNNALDIYKDYFADSTALVLEPPSVTTLALLKHPLGSGRSVQSISWCPNGSGHVAVAFRLSSAHVNEAEAGVCAIFDLASPLSPVCTIHSPSTVACLAYNLKDHSLIACGQRSGQAVVVDRRTSTEPAGQTCPRQSHADGITGLAWMQSKTGTEFATVSLDGTASLWDSRKLTERIDSTIIRGKGPTGAGIGNEHALATAGLTSPPLAASCIDCSAGAGPGKFLVGTSLGTTLAGNWRAKSPADRFPASFSAHHGPVRSISRHPIFSRYFLTAGDWTARIWSEDLKVPMVSTPYRPQYVVAAAWSTTRPSVFYSIGSEGSYEAWDILRSHKTPVLSASVADAPLTAMAVEVAQSAGLQAVGTADGTTVVVRPSGSLMHATEDESTAVSTMFERECGRERALEKAEKEAKGRARKDAARAAEPVTRVTEEDLQKLEKEFLAGLAT